LPPLATKKQSQFKAKQSQFQKTQKRTPIVYCKGIMNKKWPFSAKKTKPIQSQSRAKSRDEHKVFYNKELRKYSPLGGQKNKANQTQFPPACAFEGNNPQGELFDLAFLDLVRLRSRPDRRINTEGSHVER